MKIKIVLFLAVFLAIRGSASAQGIRVPLSVTQQNTVAGVTNVVTIPTTARIAFCSAPANGVPCSNLATTYTDATLITPCSTSTQIVLDGTNSCVAQLNSQATGGVWVPAGQYSFTVSYGGANFGPYFVTAGSTGSIGGTIASTQVAFASGANAIGGSNSMVYVPTSGGLILSSTNNGPANVTGSVLELVNPSGGLPTYIVKDVSGNLQIRNGNDLIAVNGVIKIDNTGQITIVGGNNGAQTVWYQSASVSPFGVGSTVTSFNASGVGPHVFAVNTTNPGTFPGYISFDPFLAGITMGGATSGQAAIGVNPVAGTPCEVLLPVTSGTAGQSLVTGTPGGAPASCQTTWTNSPLVASLVTTAAASDNVTIVGMTASGHCSLTPTNAAASGLAAVPYVSNKTAGQITVTHSVTANANFDILCTPY